MTSKRPEKFFHNVKAVSVVANVTFDGKKIGNLAGSIELVDCPVDEGFLFVCLT